MLGDWRAGIVAALALAASTPFRLLADSFAYPSYDFAAKTWTMLFIALGCLAVGWRRLAWMAAAGGGALVTIGLSGFEMVPAIGVYAVLFPLFFATTAGPNRRHRTALVSGLWVGGGLLIGMLFRVGHSALLTGGLDVAVTDYVNAFSSSTSSALTLSVEEQHLSRFPQDYAFYYSSLLVHRLAAYFSIHLVAVAAAFVVGGMLAGAQHRDWPWRSFKWLGIIFFSEAIWFLIFRGHATTSVHTIYQLSLSASLAVAITSTTLWQAAKHSASGRYLVVSAGAALLAASLTPVGVEPRGNLESWVDQNPQRQQIEVFSALLPADAVVVMSLGDTDPSPEYFVRRQWLNRLDNSEGRPWFLLTQPSLDNGVYTKALSENLLLKKTKEYALFDMNSSGAPLDSVTIGVETLGQGELHYESR